MSNLFKILILLIVSISTLLHVALHQAPTAPKIIIKPETTVWQVLTALGKININAVNKSVDADRTKGKQLISRGVSVDFKGKKTNQTSPKLTCIACHTIVPEHQFPATIDPTQRLAFADSLNLPFLPGPPFYGLVNRVAFFNQDYQKKFQHKNQALLKTGHHDIRGAMQACNQIYAKGRVLDNWEIESMLAYLWTLELKVGDLSIPDSLLAILQASITQKIDNNRTLTVLEQYYSATYPATLNAPLLVDERKRTSPVINDFNNGMKIYKLSCLYCHQNGRYTHLNLDSGEKSFEYLKKHFDDSSVHSMYDAHRYHPKSKANKATPPHYTAERMSDQQLQDVRFFITKMAQIGPDAIIYYKKQ